MFKLLRSRAKFFYWIIALTFIQFRYVERMVHYKS